MGGRLTAGAALSLRPTTVRSKRRLQLASCSLLATWSAAAMAGREGGGFRPSIGGCLDGRSLWPGGLGNQSVSGWTLLRVLTLSCVTTLFWVAYPRPCNRRTSRLPRLCSTWNLACNTLLAIGRLRRLCEKVRRGPRADFSPRIEHRSQFQESFRKVQRNPDHFRFRAAPPLRVGCAGASRHGASSLPVTGLSTAVTGCVAQRSQSSQVETPASKSAAAVASSISVLQARQFMRC